MRQLLLAKRQLARRPDLHRRLQLLLDLCVETPALERNPGGRLGVVRDWRAAFGAEPPVHGVAAVGDAFPLLDGARGGYLVFGDDDNEG
jgi:hypothetical protein